jgi:hypothetical protein
MVYFHKPFDSQTLNNIFNVHRSTTCKSTNYKNVYNLQSKSSQIITNTRSVQLVHKHFTICIHKSLQSKQLTISSMFAKITKYKSIDFRNIYILHQTHTTKKTYNQWVSSKMVHTYTSSTSCETCCNPKYNVVT